MTLNYLFHKSSLVLASLTIFFSTALNCFASFSDVPANHPNAVAIDYLVTEKILNGYPDGSFRPEEPVNRVEALKIILLANKIAISANFSLNFLDVEKSAWFAKFIQTAVEREIVAGYPDGTFQPERQVNLAEALKMTLLTAKVSLQNYKTNSQNVFADVAVDSWFNTYFNYAKKFELIEADKANRVEPAKLLTRGELAEISYRFLTRTERVCPRFLENSKKIPPDYFKAITLLEPLSNIFYENEIFLLRGKVQEAIDNITVLFIDEFATQTVFTKKTENSEFAIPIEFTTLGFLNFSVLPGAREQGFATSIEVLPSECQPDVIRVQDLVAPRNLQTKFIANQPSVSWENGTNNLTRLVLKQGKQHFERLISAGQNSFHFKPADFFNWQEGPATLQIFGAQSANGFSFEPRSTWQVGETLNLNLAKHFFTELRSTDLELTSQSFFRKDPWEITGWGKIPLSATAYLITPNGQVSELALSPNTTRLEANETFSLVLDLSEPGPYFLEINNLESLAVLNQPIYEPGTLPLLPDFQDLRASRHSPQATSINRERGELFRAINKTRAEYNLNLLKLDPQISEFAQQYAETMVKENFFGHLDLAGQGPDERRRKFGLPLPVSENLARETKAEYAHAGFLRSAVHRQNILNPNWQRVGIGVAFTPENDLIFVEEFSVAQLTTKNLTETRAQILTEINAQRTKNNSKTLSLDSKMQSLAQEWSVKMVTENFFALEQNEDSLEKILKAQNVQENFTLSILSITIPQDLIQNLLTNEFLLRANATKIALGVAQNSEGLLYLTLILR